MMITLHRVPHNGIIVITSYVNGSRVKRRYIWRSIRTAIRQFREEFGLVGKHIEIITI